MSAPHSSDGRPGGSLAIGASFGHYVISAPLGAGGMGEVYRAKDTKLGREVAIKVLPEAVAKDPERLARFEREAHVLASLNNPRIAAIYGIEESEGKRGLVLELIEGETLAERIGRGPLRLAEALPIVRQIAEALEAAHEKGVVHRDLKPANVKLTPDGAVKVLDFGLAKALALEVEPSGLMSSPTLTAQATRAGVILGTAAYMSPEQARGKAVDKRTDIWAFGAVFFELLTGRRAFDGETVSDTLAAVLTRDPDWASLPSATPAPVVRVLRHCLERDASRRLHDIADARLDLEEGTSPLSALGAAPVPGPRTGAVLRGLVAAIALATAFGVGIWAASRSHPTPAVASGPIHAAVLLPAEHHIAGWASPVVALSRDGRRLAFVAESDAGAQQLYVRHLDRGETQPVPDSEDAEGPFFSPDGEWVAFAVDVSGRSSRHGQLKRFSLVTGLTQVVCPIADYFGGTWRGDGTIFFVGAERGGVMKVRADGGVAEPAAKIRVAGKEVSRGVVWPQMLPGGTSVLVSDEDASAVGGAAVLDIVSGDLKDLGLRTPFARFVPTGHLLYVSAEGPLVAVAFDAQRGATIGHAVAVLKDLALSGNSAGAFAVSDTGTLAYATGYLRGSGRELGRLVRIGRSHPVPEPFAFEADVFGRWPGLSPDDRKLAVPMWDGTLRVYDLERGSRAQLPQPGLVSLGWASWTPDSRRVVFPGQRDAETSRKILAQDADGSAPPAVLLDTKDETHGGTWTPDGRRFVFSEFQAQGLQILEFLPGTAEGLRPVVVGDMPRLSPDGRWLAYQAGNFDKFEVFVQPFPGPGPRVQVSIDGGRLPQWSRDGHRIFYRNGDRFWAARFEAQAGPRITKPELLFQASGVDGFGFTGDGDIVAVWRGPEAGMARHLNLTLDWFDELRRLVPWS